MKTKIASIFELQKIRCQENGEPLIDLAQINPGILTDYRRTDSHCTRVLVRLSIAGKLQKVQKKLESYHPKMQLLVVEGYRSPSYQEKYYLKELLKQHQINPSFDFEQLLEHVHNCVALPSVAGHPTGGAVDLTIAEETQEIDMGGKIADFQVLDLLPTYSTSITPEQAQKRTLLHDLMVSEGFAPFYGEWWHFSYGDREWAAFYDRPETLYSPIFDQGSLENH